MAPGESQIGEHLSLVNFEQGVYGLEFHDDQTTDQEVEPVSIINEQVLIAYRTQLLLLE